MMVGDRTIWFRSESPMSALQLFRRSFLKFPRGHRALRSQCASSSADRRLPAPTILYSSNHLLAVNKPAGWQSVPNLKDASDDPKCLLTHLKNSKKGGGSDGSFLLPLHRLDQPVTGLLLLGKTSKAASRIQSAWKKVKKDYICVLDDPEKTSLLQERSIPLNDGWMGLSGYMLQKRRPPRDGHRIVGWSVQMIPCQDNDTIPPPPNSILCSLQWKLLSLTTRPILLVQTDQGARHMIRALLSSVGGSKIAGDLRYGASQGLKDQSVALHARRLQLPHDLKLGQDLQRDFSAPIPQTWDAFFGLCEKDVQKWLTAKNRISV